MVEQYQLRIETHGRGFINITSNVENSIANANLKLGICHLFLQHTSASLSICENADPAVLVDLENFMQTLAPDGDSSYTHNAEGPDDMPSHIRSVITTNSLSIPFANGRLNLGRWQGIYLWEHRHHGHQRRLVVTMLGE